MNTFMLVALLTAKELELKGYDSKFNPDAQLLKLAKQRGLPVYGLERTEDQAAIFAKVSPEQQAVALSAMLGGFEDGTMLSVFTDSIKLWEQADEAGMTASLTKEDAAPGSDRFMLALGPERNRRMAEKCYAMLKSGDGALVSVGAAHLLGKDSVLALLAARGVKVERVAAPAQPLSGSAF
jgi:uncharacterized protein YbaP (TraB family)